MRRPRQFRSVPARCVAVVLLLAGCQQQDNETAIPAADTTSQTDNTTDLKLHIPSPDWRDQIIYFVMIDRFADGQPGNNDQGAGEYEPGSNAKFQGGDLNGIQQQLDYIQGLGATAVWLTPPVANQWWDGAVQYGGYHGYWASHFKQVDAHFGTLEDYQRLSDALHRRGMYLVQDIVVNHTGNFFQYKTGWDASDPTAHYASNDHSIPVSKPQQAPFDQNDPRDPAQRNAAIYHWTPNIADANVPEQEFNNQLADLDDLNTDNPVVQQALRDSYGYWIKTVGVDAYRVDTAFYVPADYFRDFLYADDAAAPGILSVARQTGREQFHLFGEGFGIDRPFDDSKARKIDRYMRAPDGSALLPGMINFPLYGTLTDVFARGRPTAELAYRINNTMAVHQSPHLMPTFVDNHDVDRFLAGGDEAGLKQALLFMMTMPGIPVIYYGTEQAFHEQRASMFASGVGSDGRDHFDGAAQLYRYLQQIIALRKDRPVLSRGNPEVLASNASQPGALAYWMVHDKAKQLIVFNTASGETLLDQLATGLPAGTRLHTRFSIDGKLQQWTVTQGGFVSMVLPARAGLVLDVEPTAPDSNAVGASAVSLQGPAQPVSRDYLSVSGTGPANATLALVLDGNLNRAHTVKTDVAGHWQARLDIRSLVDPEINHTLVAWLPGSQSVSPRYTFKASPTWVTLASFSDPEGDDRGPDQHYRYPTDQSWLGIHPMDIRKVTVAGAGGSLRLDITLADRVAIWNPPNGFDHLALTVFLQAPGADKGRRDQPLQRAELPGDMRWHYRLRAHGWSNALFAATSSEASDREGEPRIPGAQLMLEKDSNTIRFIIPADAFNQIEDWRGGKLYLNAWDYDGGYKPLATALHRSEVSSDGTTNALIMDDVPVILLQ